MSIEPEPLALLAREGLHDAARRRVVPAVAGLCLLTLAMVNSCTQCSPMVKTPGGELEALGHQTLRTPIDLWCRDVHVLF